MGQLEAKAAEKGIEPPVKTAVEDKQEETQKKMVGLIVIVVVAVIAIAAITSLLVMCCCRRGAKRAQLHKLELLRFLAESQMANC